MTKSEKILIPLIAESLPNRIVNLMFYCERANDYSEEKMIQFFNNK